jgi:hypothetical protein
MFNFLFGVAVGVVLAGLGVVTLPKLLAWVQSLKAKFAKKSDDVVPQVTVPASTPAVEVTPTAAQ